MKYRIDEPVLKSFLWGVDYAGQQLRGEYFSAERVVALIIGAAISKAQKKK